MKIRISATIDKKTEKELDDFLKESEFRNKSHAIESAIKLLIAQKLKKIEKKKDD